MKYILLGFLLIIAAACSNQKIEEKQEKAVIIKTVNAEFKELSVPVHFSGMLQSEAEMKLSFKIGGIIQSIFAEEGMQVRKNQVLASLNLTEINAGLARAKAGYQKAQRDLQRVENLYADTVATLEQLQNSRTALEVAAANLQMAEFNQKHAKILAPSDGIILKKFGEENELIGPGIPVLIFSGKQQAWIVKGGLADQQRIRVAASDKAEIEFDLQPGKKYKGEVLSVAGTLDPASATYSAEIVLAEDPQNLLSGMIGKVTIFPNQKQKSCLLPVEAITEAHGMNATIFVINENNRAQKTAVKIAAILNDNVVIQSGIQDGMRIATEGAAYLMDGSLVEFQSE